MNKAVFLDRDGVINEERGEYTFKIESFKFVSDIFTATKLFAKKGFLLIIITNQSGIAKREYSIEQLNTLHLFMLKEFKINSIDISEIYFCPHHPEASLCLCRKPGSLLIEKAIKRFNIDTDVSIFIGDKERDVIAAEAVNIKGILIESNSSILKIAQEV